MIKEPIQFTINDYSGSHTLQYSPDGWDNMDIKLMRSEKYRAINQTTSEKSFRFVKDGRDILLKNICLYGIQADVSLTIELLDKVTMTYSEIGTYNFDLSTYELIKDFIVVTLKRGGLIEKVNAREGIVYELPEIQTHAEKVVVTMDLPDLLETRELSVDQDNNLYPFDATNIFQTVNGHFSQYIGLSQYADEIQTFATAQIDREWNDVIWQAPPNVLESGRYFFQTNANSKRLTIKIDISGTIQVQNPGTTATQVLFCNQDLSIAKLVHSQINSGAFSVDYPEFIINNPGVQNFYFVILYGWVGKLNIPLNQYEQDFEGTIKIESLSSPGTKIINALPAKTVFKELMRAIDETTPGYPTIQSYLLDAFDNILLTSGDALRGLDGGLKTSFNDFFKFCDVVFGGCGFKVDDTDKAILESIFNFYPDTQIADLGEVSNLSIKPWQQLFSSALNIGYKDVNIDNGSINGKFAYNTAQNYTLPITKVEKVEDLICPYQADPMAVTLTAINRENKTTTDSSQDNDVFILVTKSTGVGTAELERDNDYINAPTGFPDEAGAFNTLITPKRLLLYRGRMLSAMLNKLENENIVFNSTNKNKEFISRRTTETANIVEKDNVLISTLLPKLFNPELIECEAPITKQTIAALSTVDGYLAFTYKGVALKGYIYDISYEADRINKFKLTLISHKDNDYSNL